MPPTHESNCLHSDFTPPPVPLFFSDSPFSRWPDPNVKTPLSPALSAWSLCSRFPLFLFSPPKTFFFSSRKKLACLFVVCPRQVHLKAYTCLLSALRPRFPPFPPPQPALSDIAPRDRSHWSALVAVFFCGGKQSPFLFFPTFFFRRAGVQFTPAPLNLLIYTRPTVLIFFAGSPSPFF